MDTSVPLAPRIEPVAVHPLSPCCLRAAVHGQHRFDAQARDVFGKPGYPRLAPGEGRCATSDPQDSERRVQGSTHIFTLTGLSRLPSELPDARDAAGAS